MRMKAQGQSWRRSSSVWQGRALDGDRNTAGWQPVAGIDLLDSPRSKGPGRVAFVGRGERSTPIPCGSKRPHQRKRGARSASLWFAEIFRMLEITLTLFVRAITIKLDSLACAFARCAAILAARLRRTGTNRILTLFFLVCHASLLNSQVPRDRGV